MPGRHFNNTLVFSWSLWHIVRESDFYHSSSTRNLLNPGRLSDSNDKYQTVRIKIEFPDGTLFDKFLG